MPDAQVVPAEDAGQLVGGLVKTADSLLDSHLMRSHDLTGAVFQRLIADRRFLAAYYTTPASASLLVGLAVTPKILPAGKSWSSVDDVELLRIADFSCGTGTLLSTVYRRIGQLHEVVGGDADAIHPQMMATALVGCDVLPAPPHLTASMLAGGHPTVKYNQSSIMTVAYGKQPDGAIALGSLDLLDPHRERLKSSRSPPKPPKAWARPRRETWQSLPHASFDVVIMNPPFTRATGHEGKKIGVPNPMFAAFSSDAEEQQLIAKATERLTRGTSAHGNAGEASIFLVLADRKLKTRWRAGPGHAPQSRGRQILGQFTRPLRKSYADLILFRSQAGSPDLSFSADTGMGECLVIGRKSAPGSARAAFVTLTRGRRIR